MIFLLCKQSKQQEILQLQKYLFKSAFTSFYTAHKFLKQINIYGKINNKIIKFNLKISIKKWQSEL